MKQHFTIVTLWFIALRSLWFYKVITKHFPRECADSKLQMGSCNHIWLGEAFCLGGAVLLPFRWGIWSAGCPNPHCSQQLLSVRLLAWSQTLEFSGMACFVWGLQDGKLEMPILFSKHLRRGLRVWDGLVVDNVGEHTTIFGSIPPLKLPVALSNHLNQVPHSHQH